jgi:hypothetical protein
MLAARFTSPDGESSRTSSTALNGTVACRAESIGALGADGRSRHHHPRIGHRRTATTMTRSKNSSSGVAARCASSIGRPRMGMTQRFEALIAKNGSRRGPVGIAAGRALLAGRVSTRLLPPAQQRTAGGIIPTRGRPCSRPRSAIFPRRLLIRTCTAAWPITWWRPRTRSSPTGPIPHADHAYRRC